MTDTTTDQQQPQAGEIDLRKLQGMLEAAKMPEGPIHVDYDWDGDDYKTCKWAWRIAGVVNFVEEQDETWPELEPVAMRDGVDQICPRSEYIAAALNAMPALLATVARQAEQIERLQRVAEATKARLATCDEAWAELGLDADDIAMVDPTGEWAALRAALAALEPSR